MGRAAKRIMAENQQKERFNSVIRLIEKPYETIFKHYSQIMETYPDKVIGLDGPKVLTNIKTISNKVFNVVSNDEKNELKKFLSKWDPKIMNTKKQHILNIIGNIRKTTQLPSNILNQISNHLAQIIQKQQIYIQLIKNKPNKIVKLKSNIIKKIQNSMTYNSLKNLNNENKYENAGPYRIDPTKAKICHRH